MIAHTLHALMEQGTEKVRYTMKYVWYISINLVYRNYHGGGIKWHANSARMQGSHKCTISSHTACVLSKPLHPDMHARGYCGFPITDSAANPYTFPFWYIITIILHCF